MFLNVSQTFDEVSGNEDPCDATKPNLTTAGTTTLTNFADDTAIPAVSETVEESTAKLLSASR